MGGGNTTREKQATQCVYVERAVESVEPVWEWAPHDRVQARVRHVVRLVVRLVVRHV